MALPRLLPLAVLAVSGASFAQPEEEPATNELDLFAVESQLNAAVVSSTKQAARASEAPAVVTVITAEEIAARGYTSLAEALRVVPGLYDLYDGVTHNVGVRGINGGARAAGNVLKLMIDGQAVDYRPTTGNFFGEELLPITAVERVEVIRGPASALYGANAFLGVVNVVTKSGAQAKGLRLVGRGRLTGTSASNLGGGGEASLGVAQGPVELLLAFSGAVLNRGGLALPDSSPTLSNAQSPFVAGQRSGADVARPRTFLGTLSVDGVAGGRLALLTSLQQLDANGVFQDFGPLSSDTRIVASNQNYRLTWERQAWEKVHLRFGGGVFLAGPGKAERLDVGRPGVLLLRDAGVNGFSLDAEVRIVVSDRLTLLQGVDFVMEQHVAQTFDTLYRDDVLSLDGSVVRAAGSVLPGQGKGTQLRFTNIGVFEQMLWRLTDSLTAVAGARADFHNIYGFNFSPRAALVYAPQGEPYTLKLLYGSSFKAPSAEQLYTQPMTVLDIRGNAQLASQRAHTLELAGAYDFGELGELTVNLFATDVVGRVEFVQRGLYLQARNLPDEKLAGAEVEARWRLAKLLHLRSGLALAGTLTRDTGNLLTGAPDVPNALYPLYQLHLIADVLVPWRKLRLGIEASLVGPRGASQSNALELGNAYSLPPHVVAALSAWLPELELFGAGNGLSSVGLRLSQRLPPSAAEPGFGGIDVPVTPFNASLILSQTLP